MTKALLVLLCTLSWNAFAKDRDHSMQPGNPHWHGNERSERPGRFNSGQPAYGGNGCPQGTMQVIFAPDFLSFTVLFDKFVAQSTDSPHSVMSCNAVVPMQIPDGMQMEITRVDLRGFAGLPAQARATLNSTFNFSGPGGDRDRINLNYQFQGPYTDNYLISTDAMNENTQTPVSEVSPCGGQASLRITTELRLQSPIKGATASITLDSIDSSSHAIYYVNWKSCTPTDNGGHGPGNGGGPGHGNGNGNGNGHGRGNENDRGNGRGGR
ncbi:MAG: DUF4360 domain-containing protein [Bdellovibrionales bacterium]